MIERAAGAGGTAPPAPGGLDRRRFLFGGAVAAGLAVATGFVGEYLVRRADATASRSAVRLPDDRRHGEPTPAGADLDVPGELPFITPNDAFYRVDTALFVPAVQTDGWTLTVGGMVDRPLTLTFDELLARPLIERDVTLACVSNEVGGHYVGNARWTGTLLAPLLAEAGIQPGVTQLVSRSTDGFTTGTPASVALDGRDAMLAVAMNGEPLPLAHGFPVRMVIPGLYGYESACKWIAEIEATTYEAYSAYWVQRGWAEQVLIKTESRIDVPKRGATVPAGTVVVAGVAWAQHRGISKPCRSRSTAVRGRRPRSARRTPSTPGASGATSGRRSRERTRSPSAPRTATARCRPRSRRRRSRAARPAAPDPGDRQLAEWAGPGA